MTNDLSERVLIVAGRSQDAALSLSILAEAGMCGYVCAGMTELQSEMAAGAGAIVATDEILVRKDWQSLGETLQGQAEWSDIPVLLLCGKGTSSPLAARAMENLGNITVLERPTHIITLISALRSALKARRRQYQVREYLAALRQAEMELKSANANLEQRVRERSAEAEERAAQLTALAAEMTRTEHRERRRIAHLLHDGLQQLLVGAQLHVGALRPGNESKMSASIERIRNLLSQAIEQMRTLAVELSPPLLSDAGLAVTLHWLARRCQEQHGLEVTVDADESASPHDPALRDFLFQSARELLFNVTKHAQTDQSWLSLKHGACGEIVLQVRDEGVGFTVSEIGGPTGDHFGLFSVRERLRRLGGELDIDSTPENGTLVRVRLPASSLDATAVNSPHVASAAPEPAPLRAVAVDDPTDSQG